MVNCDITFLTVFILTHPVNFPCGRKPEHPEKTHDFRQSVDRLFKTSRFELFKQDNKVTWILKIARILSLQDFHIRSLFHLLLLQLGYYFFVQLRYVLFKTRAGVKTRPSVLYLI
jgi:hypothetical protein